MALLSVMALTLGSCTEEYEYSGAKAEGQQVYFSNALGSTVNLSNTESSYALTLNRIDTSSELTVNLTLSDESGIYSIPSSVTFAQGDSAVQFNLSYDPAKLEYDVFNDVTIAIADADYTTPYGNSAYTFSAGMPSPYVLLGTGTFADNNLGLSGYAEVEIYQNQNNPNEIRVMHPYDDYVEYFTEKGEKTFPDLVPEYLQLYIMNKGDMFPSGATATEDGLVYFDQAYIGFILFSDSENCTQILHPSMLSGLPVEYNRVLDWQDDGTPGQIQLAPYYMDHIEGNSVYGQSLAAQNGGIIITFPGFDPKDYTVEVSYLGAFSSADGDSYAMGNVTLGEDIEEAKVAVVEGNDANAALAQVISGAVETVTVTESGEVRVPCKYSGACTMVAIGYAEGEMQAYDAATFDFVLGPSQWETIGTGIYTDYVLGSAYVVVSDPETGEDVPAGPLSYEVTVQENTTTRGIYRLLRPYSPEFNYYTEEVFADSYVNSNIIINASDPEAVYIQTQSVGIDLGEGYGQILMFSNGGSYIDAGYPFEDVKAEGKIKGKLVNGVISFDTKELWWAHESLLAQGSAYANSEPVEVLTLPSAVTAQAKAKVAKSMKATKGMKSVKKTIRNNALKLNKKKAYVPVKAYQLNSNVKLNRK